MLIPSISKNEGTVIMEKGERKGRGDILRLILPLIVGTVIFIACILLFPAFMLKTEDPASYVPIACAFTVALTAFFTALTAARRSTVHFAATGLICTLVFAALLFMPAFIYKRGDDFGFTALLSVMALIFSMLGARIGKGGKKEKKRKGKRR